MNQKEQRRLVLIGIRRKGEKGFKKRFDSQVEPKTDPIKKEINATNPAHTSNSTQIMRIMPG